MRNILLGGIAAISLLAVGCGKDAKIKVDDINGLNPKDAKFAVFNSTVAPQDIDGDQVDDFDVTTLSLIASDQEDLCGALAADPDALTNLPDVQAVSIAAVQLAELGQGKDFAEGDLKGNAGIFDLFLGGAAGDTVLFSAVTIRVGGVNKVQALDDGLFAVSDGVLSINKFEPGAEISADFTATLTSETADAAFFDTDSDGDGENDLQTLANTLNVSFKNVQFCADAGQ
jgi:hypothetical protein